MMKPTRGAFGVSIYLIAALLAAPAISIPPFYRKLRVQNRTQATIWWHVHGVK
jgi:hypothetical protein